MGRSWPSFAHEECSLQRFTRDETTSEIIGTSNREEDAALYDSTAEIGDKDLIKLLLQKYKTRVTECWSVRDFDLVREQSDGTNRSFHFLEYSGTRQLAQDIWQLMDLFNAPKMHLYGISYGTTVMSTFATVYPHLVGLFVLDSNTVRLLFSSSS